eukprot:TRINITY_DN7934_c0_g1_i3.p1 TRINITY_DN7934_c0_g1~~TRINITY_DN7934_c0_g1_i3.p1  ORF type:complete len:589 (+),score=77.63 TRINITY_DN7934_c0_g1_i3:139-1905(+)
MQCCKFRQNMRGLLLLVLQYSLCCSANFCQPGDTCWPSQAELEALTADLAPEASRSLHWSGGDVPQPLPVPIESRVRQPLFGENQDLKPLYVGSAADGCEHCMFGPAANSSSFCRQSARNWPRSGSSPAFVAWPLTAQHVQRLVNFANKHHLCISVAGTGNEFLNRHTCDQGLFIRTALMKGIEWSLNSTNAWDHTDGIVRLEPGLTFSEIQLSGSRQQQKSFVAQGWAGSVGIIGWSIGGGHGPFGRSKGLGVDQILEVELVTANGTMVVASAMQNADLFWAIRGGGGSVWGVIIAITLRAHAVPEAGLTEVHVITSMNHGASDQAFRDFAKSFVDTASTLDEKWSGFLLTNNQVQTAHTYSLLQKVLDLPEVNETKYDQSAAIIFYVRYLYLGGQEETAFQEGLEKLAPANYSAWPRTVDISRRSDAWDLVKHSLDFPLYSTSIQAKSMESALVDKDVMKSKFPASFSRLMRRVAHADFNTMYHDIPGSSVVGSDIDTSISPRFRHAEFHLIYEGAGEVSEEASYFSESSYLMPDDSWKDRYWGRANYEKLLAVKKKYDPEGLIWCHQCVGSDEKTQPRRLAPVLV